MFLALKTFNIGLGDEVIVPAMTHIATAHCVSHTGAKPIFCDIDPKTGMVMDLSDLKKIIKTEDIPKNNLERYTRLCSGLSLPTDEINLNDSFENYSSFYLKL